MQVDEAVEKLGSMRKWQLIISFMVLFMIQPTPTWNKYAFVFDGYIPKHHCKVLDNSSLQQSIPKDKDGNFESCLMFVNISISNETADCKDGWEYEDQDCGLTTVNEWDLVCDKELYSGFSQIIFFFGEIFARYLCGLADVFGRKPISIVFLFLNSITGLLMAFSESFASFTVGKFLIGLFSVSQGIYAVYLVEITSKKNRDFLLNVTYFHWGLNVLFLVFIVYFTRNWRYLKFFTNIYGLAVVPILMLFLPESVYWLHANNRIKEAENVLIGAGKLNNVQFETPILTELRTNESLSEKKIDFKEKTFLEKTKIKLVRFSSKLFGDNKKVETQYSTKELYRNRYLFKHTAVFGLFLFFKVVNTIGMTFIAPAMSTLFYLSSSLNLATQIPSGFLSLILLKKYSPKKLMFFFMVLTTTSTVFCVVFLSLASKEVSNITTVVFCVLGKLCSSIVWSLSYSYSATLFPTNLRNKAVGFCYLISRPALTIASLSPYMLTILPIGTYIIFALSAAISTTMLLILPETHGIVLPETIEDVEQIYKKKNSEKTELLAGKQVESDDEASDG